MLHQGQLQFAGDVGEGLRMYQDMCQSGEPPASHVHVAEDAAASLDQCDDAITGDGFFRFALTLRVPARVAVTDVRLVLWDEQGLPALDAYSRTQGWSVRLEPGENRLACHIGPIRLRRGRYGVSIAVLDRASNRHLYWGDRAVS